MMELIRWLIFIKIVSQAVERLKKIVKKKTVMIEKDCDIKKKLYD